MTDYYSLPGFERVTADQLQGRRMVALRDAISRNNEFGIRECLRKGAWEGIVADVTAPGVPTRNTVGIRPRERLVILHSGDDGSLPAVRMLRVDFPHVVHINGTPPDSPLELCLYFESTRAALRTWTAPQFLARIQWWLTESANGTLHAADQPLELPFFNSGWELVLPPSFDHLVADASQRFHIFRVGRARRGDSWTLRIVPGKGAQEDAWGLTRVRTTPVRHGRTIHIPETLGGLAELLNKRGVDLAKQLRDQLIADIPAEGQPFSNAGRHVMLIEIPVERDEGAGAERIQRIAFLSLAGRHELGHRLGAYERFDGNVFRFEADIPGAQLHERDWQSLVLLPAAVLEPPTAENLRAYSGIKSVGPRAGLLAGAGALGSALMDLWTRSGWGTWTVVDNDHVKPHNLARHRGFDGSIGESKSFVVGELSAAASPPGIVTEAVCADVCNTDDQDLRKLFVAADLVVDCTTTLDFPRIASNTSHQARHVSAFLTPSGRDSVLLVEDATRTVRLASLEAQYYRAVIHRPWGKGHIEADASTFWTGGSCRDISARLDNASVLVHAATLSRQMMRVADDSSAGIRIWSADALSGTIEAHKVSVHASREHKLGDLKLRFDDGIVARVRAMRQQYAPKETGGILVGYFDLNLGELTLVDALPPPSDSVHSESHFIRGIAGLRESVDQIRRRTGGVVRYVGEWHSHPPGHSSGASGDDVLQLRTLADQVEADGLPVLQIIAGEWDLSFHLEGEVLQ